MTIKAILACDADWGIGKDGDLPWPHNPADLKWFKQSTLNHTVVMGKATWDSLPVKPLPNRVNVLFLVLIYSLRLMYYQSLTYAVVYHQWILTKMYGLLVVQD